MSILQCRGANRPCPLPLPSAERKGDSVPAALTIGKEGKDSIRTVLLAHCLGSAFHLSLLGRGTLTTHQNRLQLPLQAGKSWIGNERIRTGTREFDPHFQRNTRRTWGENIHAVG